MLNEAPPTPVYRFGRYTVDSVRRLLLCTGDRGRLTPKAFDLLLTLVEHKVEIVTKDELLRLVWPNSVVEEISLTRNISVLRKTLGEKPDEHNYIVTVPGTGYRFVAPVERTEPPSPAPQLPVRKPWLLLTAIALLPAVAVSAWHFWPRARPS